MIRWNDWKRFDRLKWSRRSRKQHKTAKQNTKNGREQHEETRHSIEAVGNACRRLGKHGAIFFRRFLLTGILEKKKTIHSAMGGTEIVPPIHRRPLFAFVSCFFTIFPSFNLGLPNFTELCRLLYRFQEKDCPFFLPVLTKFYWLLTHFTAFNLT